MIKKIEKYNTYINTYKELNNMLLHLEDDNIKYFKKWLKSINLNVERYGNELLLNDGTTFICRFDLYLFTYIDDILNGKKYLTN